MSRTATGTVSIPTADGTRRTIELNPPRDWATHPGGFTSRVAFAAAHVVADPLQENGPGQPAAVDWDATLAFRQHLFDHGLGVAEAMDTAQRNMGLDWPAIQELISRSAEQARSAGARIASGAGTDHVTECADLAAVTRAYAEQVAFVEGTGSQVIVMASRHLASIATSAEDYLTVYDEILSQVSRPVILHWLGPMFDPHLAAPPTSTPPPPPSWSWSPGTPTASTGSRSRSSPPSTRSVCGPRCPRASGSTPATTTTIPS